MNNIVNSVLKDLLVEGKIFIPENLTRVKLDVGTSINAPNSEYWLSSDNDVCVFGFEPNPFNVEFVKRGGNIWPVHLNTDRINKTFFMIECALSSGDPRYSNFYCTDGDSGTSSMFRPSYFSVAEEVTVPTISLKNFFDLFPWDKIEYIEHLKIDAQSADFDIVKGAGDYLRDRVLYLSVETNTGDQYQNQENPLEMKKYIEDCGFECNLWQSNGNFSNKKFQHLWDKIETKFLEPN